MVTFRTNAELSDVFETQLRSTDIVDVNERQPCAWLPERWRETWKAYQLPHPEVVEELVSHYESFNPVPRLTRRFVLNLASSEPLALLIASMAWGYGNTGYGAKHLREMLANPSAVRGVLDEVLSALDGGDLSAGYCRLFEKGRARIPHLGIAFGTKFLYFARYESMLRPRPLIYDARVAHAVTHLPIAPVFPCICDGLTGERYVSFCDWAEDVSDSYETEPASVEYVAFEIGKGIANSVRYRKGSGLPARRTDDH